MAITKILNIQSEDNRNPARHLEQALEYIQNPEKTDEKVLVGSLNCLPDTAFEQMMETKQLYGKTDKRQGYHFIISFVPGEATQEQALDIMKQFAEEFLGQDYEAVYSVHTDKNHMHGHLIFNSVSITTGAKYDYRKGDWKRKIQPITNKLCEKYHLTIQPAEYAKHPMNLSRKEWEYEQTFKEMMLKDAMFCLSYAGSLEHFQFLMRRLGYEFKNGEYLTIKMPGRKLYHHLEEINEIFSEELIKYSFENVRTSIPTYITSNPLWSRNNNMSPFQNRYYGKMYRLRMIEQKRFVVGSANYAKDLLIFHKLQEEYLFLVKNDIRDIGDLLDAHKELSEQIKEMSRQQDSIYKQNSVKKRSCKTEEQWRDYQSWHMNEYGKLDGLKAKKKEAKEQLKMITSCITEQLDTAKGVVSEYMELNTGGDIEVPEYVETHIAQDVGFDSNSLDDRGKCLDAVDNIDEAGTKICEGEIDKTNISFDADYHVEDHFGELDIRETTQNGIPIDDIRESTIDTGVEAGVNSDIANEEHVVSEIKPLPRTYAEYSLLSVEEKAKRYNLGQDEDVFKAVQDYYQSIGHDSNFSEVFDESQLLEQSAKEFAINEKAAAIAEIILERGYDYCDIAVASKAALMPFDMRDNSYNLALYSAVIKKLGVQKPMDEKYEDYQRIYDEKMKQQGNCRQNEEKRWNRGR